MDESMPADGGASRDPQRPRDPVRLRVKDRAHDDEDISRTLYFDSLHPCAELRDLEMLFKYFGQVESFKLVKDRSSAAHAGYGFAKYLFKADAEAALHALNGSTYFGLELRVNWALPSNQKDDTCMHHQVFVGDLGSDVTDALLYNTFSTIGYCSDARVMWDHLTGRPKGYGFVSFRQRKDASAAIQKMQGQLIGSRRVRVGWGQHKQDEQISPPKYDSVDRSDPFNTNVYVGNVAPETTEDDLVTHFSIFGHVAEVKLNKKGGYCFVKFNAHSAAVHAIVSQHGKRLHGRVLKCHWGKSLTSRRQADAAAASALALALQHQASLSSTSSMPLVFGEGSMGSAPGSAHVSSQQVLSNPAPLPRPSAPGLGNAAGADGQGDSDCCEGFFPCVPQAATSLSEPLPPSANVPPGDIVPGASRSVLVDNQSLSHVRAALATHSMVMHVLHDQATTFSPSLQPTDVAPVLPGCVAYRGLVCSYTTGNGAGSFEGSDPGVIPVQPAAAGEFFYF
uniref:RRM domain-containing protein n=1 Tax=Chlamydomonas euryale TaxID=1486919 RepID=A0A7R9YY94_9CHLO|mmetsp:Transcript_33643/g.100173  ORF Transcript_33643/g.100173 Transcript_33643/m.100173 type:complete len:508 (+) Transcript_33643:105-1628(+)